MSRFPGMMDFDTLAANSASTEVFSDSIYTPIEKAGEIIRKRWADINLRKAVEERLSGDIPDILKDGPNGVIWRCICTPDGEFKRFLELCKKANLKPVGFENSEDKFYGGNFTKYGLAKLRFSDGLDKNLRHIVTKETVMDFNNAEGKRMCDLKTVWGESMLDFHHFFLQAICPIMKNSIIDVSEWTKRNGVSPKNYYFPLVSFSICHMVYFDDFDVLESEESFVNEIVLPTFDEVEKFFGVKPVIVKISEIGEWVRDPDWWCYDKEAKMVMENHIKTFSC